MYMIVSVIWAQHRLEWIVNCELMGEYIVWCYWCIHITCALLLYTHTALTHSCSIIIYIVLLHGNMKMLQTPSLYETEKERNVLYHRLIRSLRVFLKKMKRATVFFWSSKKNNHNRQSNTELPRHVSNHIASGLCLYSFCIVARTSRAVPCRLCLT